MTRNDDTPAWRRLRVWFGDACVDQWKREFLEEMNEWRRKNSPSDPNVLPNLPPPPAEHIDGTGAK